MGDGAWLEMRLPLAGSYDRPPEVRLHEHERRTPLHPVLALQEMHDALTGLAGPALALDRLVQSSAGLSRSSHGLLLLCVVVQPGGQDAAQALREAATRLSATVRPGDTVARWQDDTLIALCHHLEDVQCAERLRLRAVEALPWDDGGGARLGLSGAVMWDRLSEQQLLALVGELVVLASSGAAPHPLLEVSCV